MEELMKVNDYWTTEYDLSLRLHRSRADVALCLGEFGLGSSVAQIVVDNSKTLLDRLPTQFSLVKALGRQNLHVEALEMCRSVLIELKEYPRCSYMLHFIKCLIFVKQYLKLHSDDQILGQPLMADASRLHATRFLTQACVRAYMSQNMTEFMICALRLLRMTFRCGLCGDTAMGMAGVGIFFARQGNQLEALRLVRLARALMRRTKAKHLEGWVIFGTTSFIESWSSKPQDVQDLYLHGWRSGMEGGDYENA